MFSRGGDHASPGASLLLQEMFSPGRCQRSSRPREESAAGQDQSESLLHQAPDISPGGPETGAQDRAGPDQLPVRQHWNIPLVSAQEYGGLSVLQAGDVQHGPQRPRGGLLVCRARQSSHWTEEPHHASPGQQSQVMTRIRRYYLPPSF